MDIHITASLQWYLSSLIQEIQRINNIAQKLSQLLPTDLQDLAHSMVRNRFINMTHFSETTHLNTVLISGLLCHIAVFLLFAKDITFLDLITLIHYKPTSLLDRYLPAISTSIKPSPVSPYKSVPSSIRNVIQWLPLYYVVWLLTTCMSCILLICFTHTPVSPMILIVSLRRRLLTLKELYTPSETR